MQMKMYSFWRGAALSGLALGAMGAVASFAAVIQHTPAPALDAPEPPLVTKPVIGTITPGTGWAPIALVNVAAFPFDGRPGSALKKAPLGPTSKTIFQSPKNQGTDLPEGQLIRMEYTPTANNNPPRLDGGGTHYHEFFEWGYTLKGDSVMPEPVSPFQKSGLLYRKLQGGWLSRPPYSLHGGGGVASFLRNQLPYDLLIFEEGDGHVINVGDKRGEPGSYRGRDGKGAPPGTVGDYRKVKQFTRPWLIDTVRDMDWENDTEMAGRSVKWLSDDLADGFRAQLVKIPPGWTPPADKMKTYFENANRLRYMVWGSMKVWQFTGPNDAGKAFKVGEEYFIYQPPRSIWGFGPGKVTEEGAIWLEVTYAKGLTHGGGLIEDVKTVK
ncbi:MAG: hypothetical protein ABIT36_02495 [Steroidobacteraceae bacterium]